METVNILMVEDNEADIFITHEILDYGRVLNTLNTVSSAEEGILYLNNRSPFQSAERPDIILLDLNLPKSNGFGVLVEVKSNPALMDIPVLILTSSTCSYDKEFALKNKADLYMEKPLDIVLLKSFLKDWKKTRHNLLISA